MEVRIKDEEMVGHTIHVNVYDLDEEEFTELEEIARIECNLKAFLGYLNKKELPFTYNHPFWFESKETPNLRIIPEIVKLFPVVEYNMHRVKRKNELVMEMARKYEKGLVAVTDSHSGMIGKVYTLVKGDTFREYFNNIAAGRSYLVANDLTTQDLIDEVNAWIDLIFNLDLMTTEMANFYTGIGYLDRLLRALASEALKGSPQLKRVVEGLSYRLSNSGIPASLYLRTEKSILPDIEDLVMARLL